MNDERSNAKLYIFLVLLVLAILAGGVYMFGLGKKSSAPAKNESQSNVTSLPQENSVPQTSTYEEDKESPVLSRHMKDETRADSAPEEKNEEPDAPLAPEDQESQLE